MIRHFSLDGKPFGRWIWESLWFQWSWYWLGCWVWCGCIWQMWGFPIWISPWNVFLFEQFPCYCGSWWTLAHIEVKLLPWFPKHCNLVMCCQPFLFFGVLFFGAVSDPQCIPTLSVLWVLLISQNHQSQSPSWVSQWCREFTVNSFIMRILVCLYVFVDESGFWKHIYVGPITF